MQFHIPVPPDFRFYQTFRDTTRQPFGLTELLAGNKYYTLIEDHIVEIVHHPTDSWLQVISDHENQDQMTAILADRFGLAQDLDSFYATVQDDDRLTGVTRQLEGLRIFQKGSRFETLVTAIIDQQVNLAFAETLKRRLITRYGQQINHDGIAIYKFPTAEQLAGLDELALYPLQFTRNKSRYVIRLARAVNDRKIDLDGWTSLGDDELIGELMGIYGIGRWTAEYSAMVGWGRLNTLPAADIGLMNALQKLYGLKERPDEARIRVMGSAWEPFRGLVTFYLWFALEQKII